VEREGGGEREYACAKRGGEIWCVVCVRWCVRACVGARERALLADVRVSESERERERERETERER